MPIWRHVAFNGLEEVVHLSWKRMLLTEDAGVGLWRYGAELFLDGLGDVERLDEVSHCLVVDMLIGARESLERLVGVGIALAAEDSLDALGDDSPVVLGSAAMASGLRITLPRPFMML